MKKFTQLLFLLTASIGFAQQQNVTYSVSPSEFNEDDSITITIEGSSVNEATWNITDNALYLWAWSYDLNDENSMDCPTNGSWDNSGEANKFTYNSGNDTYTLSFVPTTFYNRTGIGSIGFLIKAKDGTGDKKSQDITVQVGAFQVNLTSPANNSSTILTSGSDFNIAATNTGGEADYELFANGVSINSATGVSTYAYTDANITEIKNYELVVTHNANSISKTFTVIVNPGTVEEAMPQDYEDGITYNTADATKAILVLDAPLKDFIYVAGSFNNWQPTSAYAMKKDTESGKFWLELNGLTEGEVYTYQYWVVAEAPVAGSPELVKTADPYSTLVLSPYDDPYIPAASYPNLPAYPAGQEREVTVLQTGQEEYNWQVTDFVKPKKEDLIIYEVLVRDFDSDRNYQDLIDKIDYFKNLHINAIELMPVMEFEGNESWGYNTSFHMATDKFYGPSDKLKEFIDLCHQNGIAVILDVALNHAFGRNPMVRMWMDDPDGDGWGGPSTENPYFNVEAKHSYNVGNDFNHQQSRTQNYVRRVVKHWIEEFHIDGFRWDLTKGFTQNCSANDEACTNAYQQDRVDILKEYVDYSWSLDPNHYAIFEHLGTDTEEQEWANYKIDEGKGIMMWGIMNSTYNQLTMGYADNSNINRVGSNSRGFTGKRLIGYAESHDEERIMFKNLEYGNSNNPAHNVKDLNIALKRMRTMGAVLIPVPGPKMIWHFGDLGWEYSIFTCNDGSVNMPGGDDGDCKLDTKPQPQWNEDWLNDVERQKVYYTWGKLNYLKTQEDVFEGDYTITPSSGTSLTPKIHIWNDALADTELKDVVIVSNFNVTDQAIDPAFPYTGTWYNLLDNSEIEVTNVNATINIPAGDFRIYGNKQVELGTEDFTTQKVVLYPNPATTQFTINTDVSRVEIYSMTGQLVKTFAATQAFNLYDISMLPKGLYIVNVTDTNNNHKTLKLVKD